MKEHVERQKSLTNILNKLESRLNFNEISEAFNCLKENIITGQIPLKIESNCYNTLETTRELEVSIEEQQFSEK